MSLFTKTLQTKASPAVILIRLLVGLVFLSEGIQKFLYPELRGAGRFVKIGLPEPEFLSYFVAGFEVVCGVLIVLGLLTRLAVLPTITIMLVAIFSTKIPMLSDKGFWDMAHAARTDFSMLLGSLFLLIVGAGPLSLDAILSWKKKARKKSADA
ncbi:DoxX family protein [uncultured Gimesia sp.]|uniref:DoxX family protein n=1 Tax=uncultured Gimesia sp. TaxID=1678688 RepID=UPI0030D7990C|tara:strand:+ start:107689 stop:108150 length:462 start_codon:yes stop_codon:yes gene_type:complete